jgi:putative ABC transport system permease protein
VSLRIALRALGRNKARSALTTLGIVIGTAAVIAVVAIGQGATYSIQKQFESMGQNLLMVLPGATSSGALNMGAGTSQTLVAEDAVAIARDCPSVRAAAVIVRAHGQLVNGNINWSPATVQGCDTNFLVVRDWRLQEGETFSEAEVKSAGQVCLVGRTIVTKVFGGASPIGAQVRIKNLPFRVVGVLEKKGSNTFGQDQDDVVLLPWTTCLKKLQGSTFNCIDQIMVAARSSRVLSSLEEEVTDTLRATHHIAKNAQGEYEDDFTVRNMTEFMNAMSAATRIMTVLLSAIASISLLVGGIGIMNIMLVSVTERTREIGLRMAVGARGRDILAQFLVEAVVLSAAGGVIGVALGSGAALAAAKIAHWPARLPVAAIAVAVIFSGAVGVFFGFYPALRASRLDPIEALRYE